MQLWKGGVNVGLKRGWEYRFRMGCRYGFKRERGRGKILGVA